MTDKEQIIIDGCNVLKCRYYQYKTLKDCEMRYPESGDCEMGLLNYLFNGNLDMEKLCVDNPNCYFKQLARKTQECEELKERASIAEDNFAREVQARLYHQNEWLKFSKECEELKKQLKTSEKWRINAESLNEKLDIKNTRYRKALEEIEEYIKEEEWSLLEYIIRDINNIINKAKG